MKPHPEEPDKFDALLDHALRSYTDENPRSGLERRILNHVLSHYLSGALLARPNWPKRAWLAVAVTLAAVILYPVIRSSPVQQQPHAPAPSYAQPDSQSAHNAGLPTPSLNASLAHAHLHTSAAAHLRPSEPEIAVLKSMGPVVPTDPIGRIESIDATEQERLLARFVAAHPGLAVSVAQSQSHLDQPIPLPDIAIQPIQLQAIPDRAIVIAPLRGDRLPLTDPTPTNL